MKFIVLSAFLLSFCGAASAQDEVDDTDSTVGLPSEAAPDELSEVRELIHAKEHIRAFHMLRDIMRARVESDELVDRHADARLWFYLGVIEHLLGHKQGSSMYWRESLALDIDFRWETDLLADNSPQELFEALRSEVRGRASQPVDDSTVTPGLPPEPAMARDIYDGHIALTFGISMLGQREQSVNGVLVRGGASAGMSIEFTNLIQWPYSDRLYVGSFLGFARADTPSEFDIAESHAQSDNGGYTGGDTSLFLPVGMLSVGIQAAWFLDTSRYPGGFVAFVPHHLDLDSDTRLVASDPAFVAGPQLALQLFQDSKWGTVAYVRLGFGVERYTITLPGYKPIGPDWGPLFLLQMQTGPGWFPD